jgi:N-acetylglucosaminyldiphosphoundecaprenol N-acetyl-beta-D-mannosaminyltransferase
MDLVETSLFGIRLCAGDPASATRTILKHAQQGAGLVCVANVDMVTRAVSDAKLAQTMRHALAVVTDGMPLVWVLHRRGLRAAQRVYGPGLMRQLCAEAAGAGMPIYLYGGTPLELSRLQAALLRLYPQLHIAGAESPPLLPLDPPFDPAVVQRINASGARLVFVGLGCPKQEYWMANHAPHIDATMLGVGLAFAQIAGLKRPAPAWMSEHGLEWLFRLGQEPRRLAKRYLVGNTRFLLLLLRDALRGRA